MASGRKAKITETKYLDAVKKTRTSSDRVIADEMKVNKSSVTRYRNNNPLIFEKAESIISSFETVRFDPKNITLEMFKEIPTIVKWETIQIDKGVGDDTRNKRISALFNVCHHLDVHPDQLGIDDCSALVVEARKAKEQKIKFHHGLSYYSIRKPIRSFFQLIRGISGELLTSKGIDAGRSSGTGAHSKQRVTKEQRTRVIEAMPDATKEILSMSKYH